MTQPETQSEMTPPEATPSAGTSTLGEKVAHIAGTLIHFSTGELAMLRRGPMRKGEAGAPAFWRLSLHETHGFPDNETWAVIIQAMALLTKRREGGASHDKNGAPHLSPHNCKYPLGRALCDGGDSGWPADTGSPRPAWSELRLARLLNSRGETRLDLALRAVRMFSRANTPINCTDIAALLLSQDSEQIIRTIAKDYYRCLSPAEGKANADTKSG